MKEKWWNYVYVYICKLKWNRNSERKKISRIHKSWVKKLWLGIHLVVKLQCRDALSEKEPQYVNTINMKPKNIGKVGEKKTCPSINAPFLHNVKGKSSRSLLYGVILNTTKRGERERDVFTHYNLKKCISFLNASINKVSLGWQLIPLVVFKNWQYQSND